MSNVYQGNDPYVFVSYSHCDRDFVKQIVALLMRTSCRIWYDVGLHAGSTWTKGLPEKINNCACFLLFLSKNSADSDYVMDELTFAKSKKKLLIPIIIDDVTLPPHIEFMIGKTHYIDYNSPDIQNKPITLKEKIVESLPTEVFDKPTVPYYENEFNNFTLADTSTVFPDGAFFAGQDNSSFAIIAVDNENTETKILRYQSPPGYDMDAAVAYVTVFDDPYLVDDDSKVLFVSLSLSFFAKYSVTWPDLEVSVLLCITHLKDAKPQCIVIDTKAIGQYDEKDMGFVNNSIPNIKDRMICL